MKSLLPAAWRLGRAGSLFTGVAVAFIVSCKSPESFRGIADGTGGASILDASVAGSGGAIEGSGGGAGGSGGETPVGAADAGVVGSGGSGVEVGDGVEAAPADGVQDLTDAVLDQAPDSGGDGPGGGGASGSDGGDGGPGSGDADAIRPCEGVAPWSVGALSGYAAGTKVVYGNPPHLFQCRADPQGMWCQFNTYEPLASTEYWRGAWDDLGACP